LSSYFDIFGCAVYKLNHTKTISDATGRLESLTKIVIADLKNIIPAVVIHTQPVHVFEILSDCDELSFPLIETFIDQTHSDYHVPADYDMVKAMRNYLVHHPIIFQNESITSHSSLENKHLFRGVNYSNVSELRFFIPVLSGFPENEIIEILPYLVNSFATADGSSVFKQCLKRLIQARPPSISKSTILCSLHRWVI
jgi:hypothetical protein